MFLSLICFNSMYAQIQPDPDTAVTEEEVAGILRYLSSDALAGRETGTEGAEKAARYIEDQLKSAGVTPFFETYRDSFRIKGRTGYNIVGILRGSDPQLRDQLVVVGAHYDHIGQQQEQAGQGEDKIANGANDNASGTTAVLELAEYFGSKDPKRSMMFVLFAAEEMGLVGAERLAERLKAEGVDIYAMLNIEMIGVPMEGKNYLAYLTGFESSNFADKFNQYAGQQVLGFLPTAQQHGLFKRSDNYPFFKEFNVPAQTLSTFDFENYGFYHHVEDEYERMDPGHMKMLIEALVPGLEKMLNTPDKEIRLK